MLSVAVWFSIILLTSSLFDYFSNCLKIIYFIDLFLISFVWLLYHFSTSLRHNSRICQIRQKSQICQLSNFFTSYFILRSLYDFMSMFLNSIIWYLTIWLHCWNLGWFRFISTFNIHYLIPYYLIRYFNWIVWLSIIWFFIIQLLVDFHLTII